MPDSTQPWRIRVVSHALVDPADLIAHPDNWRAHPDRQAHAMLGAIDELGFIGEVYVSQRSGRILDGHLRVALALRDHQPTVPVGYVDCADDAEEDRILASYDPLAALAERDADKYADLITRSPFADEALRDALDELIATAPRRQLASDDDDDTESDEEQPEVDTSPRDIAPVWGVVIECDSEAGQVVLLERMVADGYVCRALIS